MGRFRIGTILQPGSFMPSLTIKNIPAPIYERLKAAAADHRRSINSHVLALLESALDVGPVNAEERLAQVRAVRERTVVSYVTEAALRRDREAGRA